MEENMLSISEAAKLLGVCENTLRDWDIEGKFLAFRTAGNHRRYSLEQIRDYLSKNPPKPEPMSMERLSRSCSRPTSPENYKGYEYWKEFVEDIKDIDQKKIISILLSNIYDYQNVESVFSTKQMLWLTKESWLRSRFKHTVSVQPMTGPASLIYFCNISDKTLTVLNEGIAAKTLELNFNLFSKVNFDQMKEVYADAIASEIDSYIFSNLLNKMSFEPWMDGLAGPMSDEMLEEILKSYDYIIGPEDLINKIKNKLCINDVHDNLKYYKYIESLQRQKYIDLFVIPPYLDPDSFTVSIAGGKYPTSNLTLPIFAPYILFITAGVLGSSFYSVLSRLGSFTDSDVRKR
jgi:excisionase family DNA binding protein